MPLCGRPPPPRSTPQCSPPMPPFPTERARLFHGVGATTGSTTTPASEAMAEDLATLAGAVLRVGAPLVFVAAPEQAVAIGLRAPGFQFPVLPTSALPAGTVVAIPRPALAAAVEAAPRISEQHRSNVP